MLTTHCSREGARVAASLGAVVPRLARRGLTAIALTLPALLITDPRASVALCAIAWLAAASSSRSRP